MILLKSFLAIIKVKLEEFFVLIGFNNRALVEGVNKVKKHMRPSQENPQGGIVEKEMSIHISNLMLVEKNTPTKVGFKVTKDGKKLELIEKTKRYKIKCQNKIIFLD